MRRLLLLPALLAPACVPPVPAAVRYASPAELVEYQLLEESRRGTRTVSVREFWTGPRTQGEWNVFDVSFKLIDSGGVREGGTRRFGWSKAGWAKLADHPENEAPVYYDPPLLLLPADPQAGGSWTGEHRAGEDRLTFTCELRAFPGCVGGLTAACSTARAGLLEQDERDYCPEVGLVSFREVSTIGGHTVERRSDGAIRRVGRPAEPPELP